MEGFCTGLVQVHTSTGLSVVGGKVAEVALKETFPAPFDARPAIFLVVENVNGESLPFPPEVTAGFLVTATDITPEGFTLRVRRKSADVSLRELTVRYMAHRRLPPAGPLFSRKSRRVIADPATSSE